MRKKVLIIGIMVIAMVLATGTIASAAGWWDERAPERGGNSSLYWMNQTDNSLATSPHGGFTDSTNLCKTCHAVHGGKPDGYRLLRNSSRETECWFCHEGAGSASSIWVYQLEDFGVTVRGEHRVADLKPTALTGGGPNTFTGARENPSGYQLHDASTSIPDSTVNGGTTSGDDYTGYLRNGQYPVIDEGGVRELYCGTCHSVHGAKIMTGNMAPSILRNDPAGNGGDANNGVIDVDNPSTPGNDLWGPGADPSGGALLVNQKIWAFCGDCHNANVNWTAASDVRPNKMTHPGNTNGSMEVYGTTQTVSFLPVRDCNSCHTAPTGYDITLGKLTDAGGTETFEVTDDPISGLGTLSNITTEGDLTNGLPVSSTFGIHLAGYPHQSISNKFIDSLQNGQAKVDNPDPYRSVPNMDKECLRCHLDNPATPTAGVGISF